jgi:RNA polymerase sigma factor (sigma-70 family)
VGGTTPRNFSPCGSCLDAGKPVLYVAPARWFTYFGQIDTPITEGLVIPIYRDGLAIGTLWIVSHDADKAFDSEDLRIMVSLAQFAGAALRESNPITSQEVGRNPDESRESAWKNYMHQIARNDQVALNALFEEARPLVFSIALRVLGFAADADEVTGDVFARLWTSGYMYEDGRGSAIGWISSITRNLAFDRLRLRARAAPPTEALYFECSSAVDNEDRWSHDEQKLLLRRAIDTLPPCQRLAIELAYFADLSHSEIAERLGEPHGTIKSRIRIELMRLRSLLAAVQ